MSVKGHTSATKKMTQGAGGKQYVLGKLEVASMEEKVQSNHPEGVGPGVEK